METARDNNGWSCFFFVGRKRLVLYGLSVLLDTRQSRNGQPISRNLIRSFGVCSFWFFFEEPTPKSTAKMDAIKKKMQAMKLEKDNAMDRADTCEQQSRDANLRAEKVMRR